jgi:hypothetical protein
VCVCVCVPADAAQSGSLFTLFLCCSVLHPSLTIVQASASSHPPELEALIANTSSLASDVYAIEVLAANITTKADGVVRACGRYS